LGKKSQLVCHLEDDDLAVMTRDGLVVTNREGVMVSRPTQPISVAETDSGKQGYRHYMLKEINEQPQAFKRTLDQYLNYTGPELKLMTLPAIVSPIQRLSIVACGTSNYAGMVGKYWLESLAGLPVDIDIASEYRYRQSPLDPHGAAMFISQSGETADTLAALQHAKKSGQHCVSIVNVKHSSIARESHNTLSTLAGPEIGVASTKAFTAQLAVLLIIALHCARVRLRMSPAEEQTILQQVVRLPDTMRTFLERTESIVRIAGTLQHVQNILYLGRGPALPLALEGALKLKEISYIHAEAYAAGELKHGPIALVDDRMPVIMIAPPGPLFSKALSNLREVKSRGAKVVLISGAEGITEARDYIDDFVAMPAVPEFLQPIIYTLPLQLLAYHIAVLKGTDIDQPRNLAKSVTVE
jgi:glucosamine--fructose-6-phosphate aminotransferase (isomerizing)